MLKKSLVIIEAFGKKDKILELFSQASIPCEVFATLGNILDLPSDSLSVDTDRMTFKKRVPVRDDIFNKILAIELANYKDLYLVTDNDVMGECIARDFLEIKNATSFYRIRLNDLTQQSFKAAMSKMETSLNRKLINEADAMRISDRIIGYFGERDKVKKSVSFGRVATPLLYAASKSDPVVKKITHRVFFGRDKIPFEIKVNLKKSVAHLSEIIATKLGRVSASDFNLKKATIERVGVPTCRPCNTADILQKVSSIYDDDIKSVMASLQKNYERGLCSYLRTDSHRLSLEDSSTVAAQCRKKDFMVDMEDLAHKWFYPYEGEVSHHKNTHPAIISKTDKIISTYDPNVDLCDRIISELFESSKNSVLDTLYSSRVDESLIFDADTALTDLLSRADCLPIWKRSFLTHEQGGASDIVVSDDDFAIKVMSQENAARMYADQDDLIVKTIANERILLKILSESKIGKPSTFIYHCIKLKKHFSDDFGFRPSLFNSLAFAEQNIPLLLEAKIAERVNHILSNESLDVYDKVIETLKTIGISSDNLELMAGSMAKDKQPTSDTSNINKSTDSNFDY